MKTVLELDLVGYSSIARSIEENTNSPETVATLNSQIQGFVDEALTTGNWRREQTVMATTGDGAILVFDVAESCHRFAEALHEATRRHNATKTVPSAKRWFRIGAATGDIAMKARSGGGYDIAGVTIANAVRLESASRPGELLIDVATYETLPGSFQSLYETEEQVPGKRDESFRARRCLMVAEAAGLSASTVSKPNSDKRSFDRQKIVRDVEHLYPEDRLETLMFLLEMPVADQPASSLPLAKRRAEVLRWAYSPIGPGVQRLGEELSFLINKDPPS